MTNVVVVILVGVWAAVLVPPALRSRRNGRPSDTVGSFHRHLSVLSRTGPLEPAGRAPLARRREMPVVGPPRPRPLAPATRAAARASSVQRRRRDVFAALCAAAAVATLAALVLRGTAVFAALLTWVALAGYVGMLLRLKREAASRSFHRDTLAGGRADGIGQVGVISDGADDWDDSDWDAACTRADGPMIRDLDDWDDWDLVDAR